MQNREGVTNKKGKKVVHAFKLKMNYWGGETVLKIKVLHYNSSSADYKYWFEFVPESLQANQMRAVGE